MPVLKQPHFTGRLPCVLENITSPSGNHSQPGNKYCDPNSKNIEKRFNSQFTAILVGFWEAIFSVLEYAQNVSSSDAHSPCIPPSSPRGDVGYVHMLVTCVYAQYKFILYLYTHTPTNSLRSIHTYLYRYMCTCVYI